jgi:hypothetical protein
MKARLAERSERKSLSEFDPPPLFVSKEQLEKLVIIIGKLKSGGGFNSQTLIDK